MKPEAQSDSKNGEGGGLGVQVSKAHRPNPPPPPSNPETPKPPKPPGGGPRNLHSAESPKPPTPAVKHAFISAKSLSREVMYASSAPAPEVARGFGRGPGAGEGGGGGGGGGWAGGEGGGLLLVALQGNIH